MQLNLTLHLAPHQLLAPYLHLKSSVGVIGIGKYYIISFIVPVILGHFRYIKEEVFGIIVVCIFICMGILLFF